MGEGTRGSLDVAYPADVATDSPDGPTTCAPDQPVTGDTGAMPGATVPTEFGKARRRFIWAASIALAICSVPYLWILWSDWGPLDPLRPSAFQDNFFDLQARALSHGRLSVAPGSLGIEGFVHGGHTYTYFGLFPSIIRLPVLLVTNSLDGKLTASSMLLAWLLTGLFASLLLWRARFLVRGQCAMGRAEAAGYGVVLATMMAGTVWMLLASIPNTFDEDIAWSICLTIGSLFALLGVLEAPSWGRVTASGVLILCANLDRATTGWACVVGAGLAALWLVTGRSGDDNRRWFLPVLFAGLIPLAVSCVIDYAKFGVLFGVPVTDQVWTTVSPYRRKFLAANGNSEVGTHFVLTNALTYLRPDGISISRVFPFVTLPAAPPRGIGGQLFDKLYRTSSLPASTPLLFLLGIWGLVAAFRRRALGRVRLTRPLLLAAGSAGAALLLWGYIAPRYLGDFVPFLVFSGAVAAADIFHRLDARPRNMRIGVVSGLAVVALFSVVANFGMAVVPNDQWSQTQAFNYVRVQKALSDLTGHPLASRLRQGSSLPAWGPAGQLYVIGNCAGFYVSNGENWSTTSRFVLNGNVVPSQQYVRDTWMTVQLGQPFTHSLSITANNPTSAATEYTTLVSAGGMTAGVRAVPAGAHKVLVTFPISGGPTTVLGTPVVLTSGTTHSVVVTTDPVKHDIDVSMDGVVLVRTVLPNGAGLRAGGVNRHAAPGLLTVEARPAPAPSLCQSLVRQAG